MNGLLKASHTIMTTRHAPAAENGFTMIEVLVAIIIVTLGLLGLAGLQGRMQTAEYESYQRSQALVLLYDMVERVNSNRATAPCFAITNASSGTPYLGTGSATPTACAYSTAGNNAMADASIAEWDQLLKGAAETKGTSQVGAMTGARGCITYDATTEVPDASGNPVAGTGTYTVSVAWQGYSDLLAPTNTCATSLYGAETRRRVVSTSFRLAYLK